MFQPKCWPLCNPPPPTLLNPIYRRPWLCGLFWSFLWLVNDQASLYAFSMFYDFIMPVPRQEQVSIQSKELTWLTCIIYNIKICIYVSLLRHHVDISLNVKTIFIIYFNISRSDKICQRKLRTSSIFNS